MGFFAFNHIFTDADSGVIRFRLSARNCGITWRTKHRLSCYITIRDDIQFGSKCGDLNRQRWLIHKEFAWRDYDLRQYQHCFAGFHEACGNDSDSNNNDDDGYDDDDDDDYDDVMITVTMTMTMTMMIMTMTATADSNNNDDNNNDNNYISINSDSKRLNQAR